MPTETPKPARVRKPRRNFQKLVESTTLFCELAIQTCEDFKPEATAQDTARDIDAQIRAYKRVLAMLNGDAK